MSFDFSFSFGDEPVTPPDYGFEPVGILQPDFSFSHGGSHSHTSIYSDSRDSSPESSITHLVTPVKSPTRQHGPLLLPKIRSQDQAINQPAPKRIKTMPAKTGGPVQRQFRPTHTRSYTNPENIFTVSPKSTASSHGRSSSITRTPIVKRESQHQRCSSTSSLDGQTLGKYGFPYQAMPAYIPSGSTTETFNPQAFQLPAPREPSPMRHEVLFDNFNPSPDFNTSMTVPLAIDIDGTSSNLLTFLTSPNPAPSLVRQINIPLRDPNTKHFWWDVRQIRPWTSFSTQTISSTPGLLGLLSVPLPEILLPVPAQNFSQHPETESALHSIYTTWYTSKLNTAISLSQGPRHLLMRSSLTHPVKATPTDPLPAFFSNYVDDTSELIYARAFGRVVGLVKSFDRWNSGMRCEGNHKKVEYLRGLAHLHRQMREHGCRYGFIMTEIELVVVRNGTDSTPCFGYLEVMSVPLAACDVPSGNEYEEGCEGEGSVNGSFGGSVNGEEKPLKMTALLALWYLHMLARDEQLPGQVTWKTEIGAPAEGTRRKCLPRDSWMPAPQVAEKREAKRVRGWVWPEESVGRKEMGKRGIKYSR